MFSEAKPSQDKVKKIRSAKSPVTQFVIPLFSAEEPEKEREYHYKEKHIKIFGMVTHYF